MTIIGPIRPPIVAPVQRPLSPGLPWDQRGSSPLLPPSAPVISTASFTIGGTITWSAVPGATSYTLYRDGVSAGTVTSPYTIVAADVGPSITVKAVNSAGSSAASNTLAYALPTASIAADYDATHVTLTSSRVSAVLNQVGGGADLTNGVAGSRPTQSVGGGPNGRDALDFALNAGTVTNVSQSALGLGATVSIYTVVQMPASSHYICDAFSGDLRVIGANVGATAVTMYAGSSGPQITAPAVGTWMVVSCIFNGASSKGDINGGTAATGNVGAGSNAGHTLGSRAGGTATTGLEKLWARQLIYTAAHSDATRADIGAYLKWWAGL